jgi:hypothetical protein
MMPSFLVYHPVSLDGGCAFDATPFELRLLEKGTPELIAESLRVLGFDGAVARGWDIETFCSPYFGREAGTQWIERVSRAWRVKVRFEQPFSAPRRLVMGPESVDEPDPTWPFRLDISWTELRCDVIAHFLDRPELTRELAGEPLLEARTLLALHPRVQQLRVNLGRVKLPDDEPRIRAVRDRCRELGGAVTWESGLLLQAKVGR